MYAPNSFVVCCFYVTQNHDSKAKFKENTEWNQAKQTQAQQEQEVETVEVQNLSHWC